MEGKSGFALRPSERAFDAWRSVNPSLAAAVDANRNDAALAAGEVYICLCADARDALKWERAFEEAFARQDAIEANISRRAF